MSYLASEEQLDMVHKVDNNSSIVYQRQIGEIVSAIIADANMIAAK